MTTSSPRVTPAALTPNALRRRLKRRMLKDVHTFFAICQPGFEPYLASEIAALELVQTHTIVEGGVEFTGPLDLIYHTNLHLRTAVRVLLRIASFKAFSYPELHNKTLRVAWEHYVGFQDRIAYDVSAKRSKLNMQKRIIDSVHEGAQRVMEKLGRSLKCSDKAGVCVSIRLSEDICTLSVDTSGDTLHKRGYRQQIADAPLRETTAAAILNACDFRKYGAIVDPMCGSGTFLIEAALMLRWIAPGSGRAFAFQNLPWFTPGKWDRLRTAVSVSAPGTAALKVVLRGSDINAKAIEAAAANAQRAQVSGDITFSVGDMRADGLLHGGVSAGLIISNLPYGKRSGGDESVEALYKDIVRVLCANYRGWDFCLVTLRGALPRHTALSVRQRLAFNNGGIPVECLIGSVVKK